MMLEKMEEGAMDSFRGREQKQRGAVAESLPLSKVSHSEVASSSQDTNQQEPSSLPAFSRATSKPCSSHFRPTLLDDKDEAKRFDETRFGITQETGSDPNTSEEEEPKSSNSSEWPRSTKLSTTERDQVYRAILEDNSKGALDLLKKRAEAFTYPITQQGMNALQLAIALERIPLAKKLLKIMKPEELEVRNSNNDTSLGIAAMSGVVKIAKELVKTNKRLLFIRNTSNFLPVHIAALQRRTKMVSYLYSVTPLDEMTEDDRIHLIPQAISCDLYDIALELVRESPNLATAEGGYGCLALEQLAKKPFAIASRRHMSIWQSILNLCFKGICHKALMQTIAHQLVEVLWKRFSRKKFEEDEEDEKLSSMVFLAAELGNVAFLKILLYHDPELIWRLNKKDRNIFHVSILNRQERIFKIIYEVGIFKDVFASCIDSKHNNMLHLVGKLPPPDRLSIVAGAALQMQYELLWFKEIEKIVPPAFLNEKNLNGLTPQELFNEEHEKLHRDGEKWMRNTATHCMLVATLIATVVFAAAFTVPGGNNQTSGFPIFGENDWFLVFFFSDSIALLSSSTSILIFLSILTSRYTQTDLLHSLPRRLLFGLSTLFISIVAMIIAFSATSFLVYQSRMAMVPIVVIGLAGCPISIFVVLHFGLWVDVIRSTFWSKFLFGRSKRRFFKPIGRWQLNM